MPQFRESRTSLEAQLVEIASKKPKAGWILDEYHSTAEHANIALKYVLQHGAKCGHVLARAVRLETKPTHLMNAYATRDSLGTPLIYINTGLRFFLMMLNYHLASVGFKDAVLGGRGLNATMFTIAKGHWPSGVDLLSEIEPMGGFPEDQMRGITAWLQSQLFFVVAHEFGHHLIWSKQKGFPETHFVRLLSSEQIEVYNPSQKDELKADEYAFDIWLELDSTVSDAFSVFTAGGIGALLGYFRILEEYSQYDPVPSQSHPPSVDRYERLKARLSDSGRPRSVQAMEETWAVTEILRHACIEARQRPQKQASGDVKPTAAEGEGPARGVQAKHPPAETQQDRST